MLSRCRADGRFPGVSLAFRKRHEQERARKRFPAHAGSVLEFRQRCFSGSAYGSGLRLALTSGVFRQ
jgi:hypothetical protein